jgi:hypothetical protein
VESGFANVGAALRSEAALAYVHSVSIGCWVAAGVAVVGTVVAAVFLPAQPLAESISLDDEFEVIESETVKPDAV